MANLKGLGMVALGLACASAVIIVAAKAYSAQSSQWNDIARLHPQRTALPAVTWHKPAMVMLMSRDQALEMFRDQVEVWADAERLILRPRSRLFEGDAIEFSRQGVPACEVKGKPGFQFVAVTVAGAKHRVEVGDPTDGMKAWCTSVGR